MDLAVTVLVQVLIMFLLVAIGYLCVKIKLISSVGTNDLTNILLYVVNPAVIITAYQVDFSISLLKNLGFAFLLAVISHTIAIILSYLLIRNKKGNEQKTAVERFSVIYTNCGFMALPLISALFGNEGVFYASAYIAVFNLLSWTHGYILMSGKADKSTLKNAFLSPVVISVIVGLLLFFLKIQLPFIVKEPINYLSALNTPLAMLVLGANLAGVKIFSAFTQKRCWYVVFLSCILVPFVVSAVFLFIPINRNIILVSLIATACPPAVTTLLFASKHNRDTEHASRLLTLANVCSIVTIPLVILMFQTISSLLR